MTKLSKSLYALLWSLLLPGLGHIFLGRILQGAVFFACFFLIQGLQIFYMFDAHTKAFPGLFNLVLLILYLFSAISAYRFGRRLDGATFAKRCAAIYILFLCIVLGPAFYVRTYYLQPFRIPSATMSPTLIVGDKIMTDKSIYKKENPQRGDIIVFISPQDPKKKFAKRIVGLPNEDLEIKDGHILINKMPLTSPAIFNELYYYNRGQYGAEGQTVHVPADSYYVLGDNGRASYDSRYWGFVPKSSILGKAYKIYAPDDRSGPIN